MGRELTVVGAAGLVGQCLGAQDLAGEEGSAGDGLWQQTCSRMERYAWDSELEKVGRMWKSFSGRARRQPIPGG